MPTKSPIEVMAQRELEADGWIAIHTMEAGFPDFFCIKNTTVKLVEVKSRDRLSREQIATIETLRKAGVNVEVRILNPRQYVKSEEARKHMSESQRKRWERAKK